MEERLKFNEGKIMILNVLRDEGMTSTEVADRCGISTGAARSLLRRHHLNGLLKREKDPKDGHGNNPYLYRLLDQAVNLLDQGKIRTRGQPPHLKDGACVQEESERNV